MQVAPNLRSAWDATAATVVRALCRSTQKLRDRIEKYLVNALQAYKSGRRSGTYAALMAATAVNLSDVDIENLAAYLASLDDGK